MSERTLFTLDCLLKLETPNQVTALLEFMTNHELELNEAPDNLEIPNHLFFKTDLWEEVLRSGDAWFWKPEPVSSFKPSEDGVGYRLIVNSAFKDSENQVEQFLHWFVPYSASEGVVGSVYRSHSNEPVNILFQTGKAFLIMPVFNTFSLEDDEAEILLRTTEPFYFQRKPEDSNFEKTLFLDIELKRLERDSLLKPLNESKNKPRIEELKAKIKSLSGYEQ